MEVRVGGLLEIVVLLEQLQGLVHQLAVLEAVAVENGPADQLEIVLDALADFGCQGLLDHRGILVIALDPHQGFQVRQRLLVPAPRGLGRGRGRRSLRFSFGRLLDRLVTGLEGADLARQARRQQRQAHQVGPRAGFQRGDLAVDLHPHRQQTGVGQLGNAVAGGLQGAGRALEIVFQHQLVLRHRHQVFHLGQFPAVLVAAVELVELFGGVGQGLQLLLHLLHPLAAVRDARLQGLQGRLEIGPLQALLQFLVEALQPLLEVAALGLQRLPLLPAEPARRAERSQEQQQQDQHNRQKPAAGARRRVFAFGLGCGQTVLGVGRIGGFGGFAWLHRFWTGGRIIRLCHVSRVRIGAVVSSVRGWPGCLRRWRARRSECRHYVPDLRPFHAFFR